MYEMWILIMIIMLSICSYTDIKERYVDVRIIVISFIAELFLTPLKIYGVIPVIILCIFCFIKKGIGSGDILIFFVIGIFSGLLATIQIMMISFVFALVYGLFSLFFRNKDMKYCMPFIPFVLMGFVIFEVEKIILF